jgi:hypothetical protein
MILLPTLNRPHLLKRFFESYKATNATVAGYVLIDHEDMARNRAEYETIKMAHMPGDWIMRDTGSAVSMGDKCRFVWRELSDTNKWIGLLNDDHVCITNEWDKRAEEMLDGTNMLSTNDGSWNFGYRIVGLTAWSKPLLDIARFPIFPRNLQHYFIDDLWKAIGESTGCWLETMKINIEHRHVLNGKMLADDTFRKVNDPKANQYDEKEFKHFMEQDFKDLCLKIVEFRSKQTAGAKFV